MEYRLFFCELGSGMKSVMGEGNAFYGNILLAIETGVTKYKDRVT
jgi:hypothetical protein